MVTIAISIDKPTLEAIDEIANPGLSAGRRVRRGKGAGARSRSAVMRQALQEYVAQHAKREREAGERQTLAKHRAKLARQAKALIAEQARP
jgi:metal-responsive CopG/Arc/MetJ family transcriptional regulator